MKTIYITEAQKKKIKKAIAAQDQVGGKVNAGVMDAVAYGGGMCESVENGMLDTWYRGFNNKYPNLGVPPKQGIWITDEADYAEEYALEFGEDGRVAEVVIDWSKINYATEEELEDNELDPYYSGEEVVEIVRNMGFNAWLCNYSHSQGLCLIDTTPIVSVKILPWRYNSIDENVEDDEYKLGAEKGMSPYYHVTEGIEPNRMVDVQQLIRSDKFKAWFGDWENDPQNASKAVDKNGFPLIVHHGSPKFIGDKFDKEKIGNSINHGEGDVFCATQDMSWAKRFSYPATQGTFSFTIKPDYSKPGDILSGFLNLRHPLDFFHLTDEDWKNIRSMIKDTYFEDLADREGYMENQKEVIEKYVNHQLVKGNIAGAIKLQFGTFGKQLKRYGYDGLIADMGGKDGAIEYCFLEPNQFKSIYALSFNPHSESIYESKNYDMSEIGAVNCQLDFDEDEYIEWLNDNELQDIPEVKTQFIKDYCTYSIEYLTAETFHSFDYDDLTYDEVIDTFGENMGMAMINDCMDGKEHSFETLEYAEDTPVDLTNPKEVNAAAKKYMRSVDHPAGQFRGFILTDGTVVDAGWDHIACTRIPGVKSREHFVQLGNIRFSNTGLEFAKYPTHEQLRMLRIYCEYHQSDTIYVDIVNEKNGRGDFTYNGIDFQELVNDLYNYFTHGIKNHRNDLHESLDELDLYHGTHANFDKFDEKFYLTGVGEMAYGWGVYLSNSINTAKEYSPGGQIMTVQVPEGKYLDSRRISKAEASKLAHAFYKSYLSGKGGELYKGSEKEFWDYECSCIENVPDGSYLYGTISTFLGSDKEASEWLHSMGYVGLRFPGHNQSTGERFMNYVIFDANDVKIIKKEKNELHENIENDIITLYHGVREKDLEYNIEKGGFYPRVCSEGGPKAIWLSEKQYGYPFIFKFEMPRNAVEQVSNVDYIYTQPISFNNFSCELVRTQIYAYPVSNTAVEVNICDDRMSKIQFRYFPNLGITLWKMFKDYPRVLGKYINPYIEKCQHLNENVETEIVNPDDVDLSSFNIKKNLNPKFWKDGVLDSRIRMKLLDIADDFIEFLGVDWAKPEDITMTGSLANFNWNENYSDIDLHIVMDYSDVDERTDFVSNYFYSQKKLWNEEHSDITIMGFPVEVFVQDINERHDSSGVYSLEKNKWLIEPEREKLASSKVNKAFIKDKVSDYMNKIDKLEYLFNKTKDDEYRLRRVMEKSDKLFDKIKGERKLGFERSGGKEINNYNIIFKALRRNGYIEKLVNIKSTAYDKLKSLQ